MGNTAKKAELNTGNIQPKDNSREIREAVLNDKIIRSLQAELDRYYMNAIPMVIKKKDGSIETVWTDSKNLHPKAKALQEQIEHRIKQITTAFDIP